MVSGKALAMNKSTFQALAPNSVVEKFNFPSFYPGVFTIVYPKNLQDFKAEISTTIQCLRAYANRMTAVQAPAPQQPISTSMSPAVANHFLGVVQNAIPQIPVFNSVISTVPTPPPAIAIPIPQPVIEIKQKQEIPPVDSGNDTDTTADQTDDDIVGELISLNEDQLVGDV